MKIAQVVVLVKQTIYQTIGDETKGKTNIWYQILDLKGFLTFQN
jgi:hypothetical protein